MSDTMPRLISLFGLVVLIATCWLMSSHRRFFPWRVVLGGLLLQFVLAGLVLRTHWGRRFFDHANAAVNQMQSFVEHGSKFVFGLWNADAVDGQSGLLLGTFAFGVLPTVIFYSSLMAVLYHLGIMQWVVKGVAWVMQRTLGTSGPETLAAAANIFLGHTEAPLVIKPFIPAMSRSELNAMMIGGFANVSASLLGVYSDFGVDVGHLITASVISAPASLLIAKIMLPELPGAAIDASLSMGNQRTSVNVIGAAADGASDGLKLALNIGAMLIAFLALIAMADYLLGQLGWLVGFRSGKNLPTLSLSRVLSALFAPVAWLIGVPWSECADAGRLLGTKMLVNELVAYQELGVMLKAEPAIIGERTKTIMTYALCGFANFGAIGIQVGGIGGLVPERRNEIASLGLRAMLGGTISCLMTACIAGLLI
jgi:concentrative nucleoside transporter, CNT family